MADGRAYLPVGTKLKLESGNIYKIIGEPLGRGGGSILYPAHRLVVRSRVLQSDGFLYVLKECYPVSSHYSFVRNESGEIVPQTVNSDSRDYLNRAKKLLLKEGAVSSAIYQTASRMVPTREAASQIVLEIPGKTEMVVSNTVTVMESLSEKGRSITAWIQENRRFSPFETFRIIQQLLFALKEVHQAGYLHLDIQDGNVFLKGTLAQKDELVTLIDFGSARPMADGRTAPIRDKVIFTTPGFAAPEMLLRNDGTLQLGVETDIYSVGCLALYLLTGRKPDTRTLLENRTGIYLKPNELRRIKCPKHLVDRMQQILATALDRRPRKRYHSADEMLRDVTDFVEALQPYRTDLSAVKYDAFICYKHGPIDSEAAVTLQRELENYRAPKGVSQSRKPFKRVFVDEGELSSCADFGQQIREALQNSGWLIVVCSENTPNSPWVQLEIDTFLETHSRSRVLCVMTGGDEKVSFPPQLKGNQTDEGEVLAADARGSGIREVKKKLRKDALLKIAAPMLGTTFDSLRQRHKLYQMQRIAAVAAGILAVTVGFAAYAANRAHVIAKQAVRIEEEYENVLINESLFLAEQAGKRLDENDPLGALELVLKALPSGKQNRPLLAEAEYVLGEALGIYTTPHSAQNTVTAVNVYDSAYAKFFLSLDGKHLINWNDLESSIQVVDTETMSSVQHIHLENNPLSLSSDYLLQQNRIVVPVPAFLDRDKIKCIDYLSGSTIWEVLVDNMIGARVTQDRSKVIVISGEQGDYLDYNPTEYDVQKLKISIFSASSGDLLDQLSIQIDGLHYIDSEIFLSSDGGWLAFYANIDNTDSLAQAYNAIYVVNLKTGKCRKLIEPTAQLRAAQLDENRLIAIRSVGETYVFDYQRMGVEPISYFLESYDLQTGKLHWSMKYQCYDAYAFDSVTTSASVQYMVEQETRKGTLYAFSNICILLDQETGDVVKKYNMNSAIIDISCNAEGFDAICADGSNYVVNYQNDMIRKVSLFDEQITALCKYDTTYYAQSCLQYENDYSICKYELEKYDDSYVQLFESKNGSWGVLGNYCAVDGGYQFTMAQRDTVRLIDTSNGNDRIYKVPPEYEFVPYSYVLGFSPDRSKIYWKKTEWEDDSLWIGDYQYYYLDTVNGQIVKLLQPEKPATDILVYDTFFDKETLFFITSEYQQGNYTIRVWSWDFLRNTLKEHYCSSLGSYVSGSLHMNGDATGLWFATSVSNFHYDSQVSMELTSAEKQVLLVYLDLVTGKVTKIPMELQSEAHASLNESLYWWDDSVSTAAVVFDDVIYVVDTEGNLKFRTSGEDDIAVIWFSPDDRTLFAMTEEGVLRRYDIHDGTVLSSIELRNYSEYFQTIYASSLRWNYYDPETLAVSNDNESILIDVSNNTLKIKAIIDQFFTYDSQNDRYLVVSVDNVSDTTEIGYFPRYSIDDLIGRANEILS